VIRERVKQLRTHRIWRDAHFVFLSAIAIYSVQSRRLGRTLIAKPGRFGAFAQLALSFGLAEP
jgi:hypothetical protein